MYEDYGEDSVERSHPWSQAHLFDECSFLELSDPT